MIIKSESSSNYLDLQDTMARYNSELLQFSRLDSLRETDCRWVRTECSKDETTLKVKFIDPGKGIPEECREKIIQPFFTTKPVGQGTGLRLRIIKGVIEQDSGKFFWIRPLRIPHL